jgi:hypothetical protein
VAGLALRLALLVPVRHPGADEDAKNDDGELDADGRPVLRPQLCNGSLEDHDCPRTSFERATAIWQLHIKTVA